MCNPWTISLPAFFLFFFPSLSSFKEIYIPFYCRTERENRENSSPSRREATQCMGRVPKKLSPDVVTTWLPELQDLETRFSSPSVYFLCSVYWVLYALRELEYVGGDQRNDLLFLSSSSFPRCVSRCVPLTFQTAYGQNLSLSLYPHSLFPSSSPIRFLCFLLYLRHTQKDIHLYWSTCKIVACKYLTPETMKRRKSLSLFFLLCVRCFLCRENRTSHSLSLSFLPSFENEKGDRCDSHHCYVSGTENCYSLSLFIQCLREIEMDCMLFIFISWRDDTKRGAHFRVTSVKWREMHFYFWLLHYLEGKKRRNDRTVMSQISLKRVYLYIRQYSFSTQNVHIVF